MVRQKQTEATYLPCQDQSYRSPGNLISALDSYESIQLSLTAQDWPLLVILRQGKVSYNFLQLEEPSGSWKEETLGRGGWVG